MDGQWLTSRRPPNLLNVIILPSLAIAAPRSHCFVGSGAAFRPLDLAQIRVSKVPHLGLNEAWNIISSADMSPVLRERVLGLLG